MDIKFIDQPIGHEDLKRITEEMGWALVKAVVDVKREVMAIGGEMHADEEQFLLEHGSKQDDLWGINLYPDEQDMNFIEFDSMINLRPSRGNRTRGVDDSVLREHIKKIVLKLIQ